MELQQQEHLQFQFLPQRNESVCFEKNGFRPKYINQSLNLSSTIFAQMEQQRQETDQFLSAQVLSHVIIIWLFQIHILN